MNFDSLFDSDLSGAVEQKKYFSGNIVANENWYLH